MSAAAASSMLAAVSWPFATASSAAAIAATPPIARKRLPPVRPFGTMSVSPCTTSIVSASMPSFSDSTCLKLVTCPWPLSCIPEITVALPSPPTLSVIVSPLPPPQRSMYIASPMPRRRPSFAAPARRAANPAQSALRIASRIAPSKSPLSYSLSTGVW